MFSAHERPERHLIVDGANVVGSRPDGWWNDRAGAAARLHARLVGAPLMATHIVLVLEGRARAGVPAGRTDGIDVVHAPGEGDDTIVEEARRAGSTRQSVCVVTADRGLRARLPRCHLIGPSELARQLA